MVYFTIKTQVMGKEWDVRLISKKRFRRKHGKGVAVTLTHKRRIDFMPKYTDRETIIHELFHAYLYEMCLGSTDDITTDDQEEIFAELFAHHGQTILQQAFTIDDLIRQEASKL